MAGPAISAGLNRPIGVCGDGAGNLYIADYFNQRVRKVMEGYIYTVAGNGTAGYGGDNGPATIAKLNYPRGVWVGGVDTLYIADMWNYRVRRATYVGGAKIVTMKKSLPTKFALVQNYPNPFNPETLIEYHVPREAFVSLKVYDILGQTIRTLVSEPKRGGVYWVRWDGRDATGHSVASGVYFYRMEAADFVQVRKMLILR